MMKEVLNRLFRYETLSREEAFDALSQIATGQVNPSQMAAFLTVYMMRSIKVEELEGFRDAMLELCVRVPVEGYNAIDLCGTGGDGKNTFNISTTSSFVVAGADQHVVKHGNYGVSSVSGSSNVLEFFGCKFSNDIDKIRRSLDGAGITFLHAPLFHPAMKNVGPVRKELGLKTFFNMLGPMVNPAFPKNQLVGVFSLELARLYGYLYENTTKNYVILHSLDNYDEISLTDGFKLLMNQREEVFYPEDLGFERWTAAELHGGQSVEEAAGIFMKVLEGKGTPAQQEVVIANAGLAIAVGKQIDINDGLDHARESLESGNALRKFKKFIELNQ